MTKAIKEIKGNCLKVAEKQIEVKLGKFCKGRENFPLRELTKYVRRKAWFFLEGKNNFLMSQEKKKAAITQKQHRWLRESPVFKCEGLFGLGNNSAWSYFLNFPRGTFMWLGFGKPWGWLALTGHHWPPLDKQVNQKGY